jgi:NADH:ubiquinone oxidoreductase subunit E
MFKILGSERRPVANMTISNAVEQKVLLTAFETLREQPGALLPVLYSIQRQLGYVPPALAGEIASTLNRSVDEVLNALQHAPGLRSQLAIGPVVQVCLADACFSRGADALWAHLQKMEQSGAMTGEAVFCLGMCGSGPSVQVDGTIHVNVDPERLEKLLRQ